MDKSKLAGMVPKMLERFPLMVPNRLFREYQGYLHAGESDVYLHILVPNLPSVRGMKIVSMSEYLEEITQGSKQELAQWLSSKSRQFYDFLVWLQNLVLTKESSVESVKQPDVPIKFWRGIVSSLATIGYKNLNSISENDFGHLQLKVESKAGLHILDLTCNSDNSVVCQCPNFPEKSANVVAQSTSIVQAYEVFEEEVDKLQLFWKVMQELDNETHVLDPQEPNLSHVRRQISIESGFSVTVTVDPYSPLSLPEITFLGPTKRVQELELCRSNNKWRLVGNSLLRSLEKYLEVEFPSAPDMDSSQMSQDQMCNICFDSEGLNRTCEWCNSQFHEHCLLGWLQSVPSNQTVFNRIAGQCPLCKQVVTCVI